MWRELANWWHEVVSTIRRERIPILFLIVLAVGFWVATGGITSSAGGRRLSIDRANDLGQSLVPELVGAIITFLILRRVLKALPLAKIMEHDKLPVDGYIDRVERNRSRGNGYSEHFRILESFTRLVNSDDYHDRFEFAISQAFNNRGNRSLRFQILLVHPYSQPAKIRGEELDKDDGRRFIRSPFWNTAKPQRLTVEEEIEQTLRKLYAIRMRLGGRNRQMFEVKLHASPLRMALYMWDSGTYFSHFSSNKRSDEVPCLEATAESEIHRSLVDWFNDVWSDENTLPLNNHMTLGAFATDPISRKEGMSDDQPDLYFHSTEQHLDSAGASIYALLAGRQALRSRIETDEGLSFSHDFRSYSSKARFVTDNLERDSAYQAIRTKYGSDDLDEDEYPHVLHLTDIEVVADFNPGYLS